jgi:phospholipid:diacylglycerol acyltransferase
MHRRRNAKENDHPDDGQTTSLADSPPKGATPPAAVKPEPSRKQSFITKPKSKRRNGLIFLLGGIFGIFFAVFFAQQQDVISLESLMDLNLESLMDAIPQNIMRDAREFSVCGLVYQP